MMTVVLVTLYQFSRVKGTWQAKAVLEYPKGRMSVTRCVRKNRGVMENPYTICEATSLSEAARSVYVTDRGKPDITAVSENLETNLNQNFLPTSNFDPMLRLLFLDSPSPTADTEFFEQKFVEAPNHSLIKRD
jgi:hypothetical protein